MNRARIAVLGVVFFALATACFAQEEHSEITFYAGGFLGDSFIVVGPAPLFEEVEAVFDDDFTVGFRYGYWFHPKLAMEFGVGFTPSTVLASGNVNGGSNVRTIFDVNTYVLHANLVYRFTHGSFVPYVTAGVGGVHFNINTASRGFLTPSETDFAVNAGGGFKFRLHEDYFFRADGRVYRMDPEFSEDDSIVFGEITGGIAVLFEF